MSMRPHQQHRQPRQTQTTWAHPKTGLNTPAQRAMTTYFQKEGPKYRGRPPCNLPNTINKDLNKIIQPTHVQLDHSYSMQTPHNKLNCEKHLESLRTLAADKTGWQKLALNVATSDNWQA